MDVSMGVLVKYYSFRYPAEDQLSALLQRPLSSVVFPFMTTYDYRSFANLQVNLKLRFMS